MVRTFVGAAGDSLVLLVVLGRVWSQFEHGEAFVPARWSRILVVGRARRSYRSAKGSLDAGRETRGRLLQVARVAGYWSHVSDLVATS